MKRPHALLASGIAGTLAAVGLVAITPTQTYGQGYKAHLLAVSS
jgi:hypothetical protein